MSKLEIGCCGAYCGSCPVLDTGNCRGCKIGYENGERDITKARCRIKVCCITKNHATCADCLEYTACPNLNEFYSKHGYKYKKYWEATLFIRNNGYNTFLKIADTWKNAYGKYE